MADPALTPASYIVLGIIAVCGPQTSYDLKKCADGGVGYFWSLHRSHLYAEPLRLTKFGLLREETEQQGRRRRVYQLTAEGREALQAWLREPTLTHVELRDLGLLKLYFSELVTTEDVTAIAHQQAKVHQQRLDEYQRVEAELARSPQATYALTALRMGLKYEQISIEFWQSVIEHPPQLQSEPELAPLL